MQMLQLTCDLKKSALIHGQKINIFNRTVKLFASVFKLMPPWNQIIVIQYNLDSTSIKYFP